MDRQAKNFWSVAVHTRLVPSRLHIEGQRHRFRKQLGLKNSTSNA